MLRIAIATCSVLLVACAAEGDDTASQGGTDPATTGAPGGSQSATGSSDPDATESSSDTDPASPTASADDSTDDTASDSDADTTTAESTSTDSGGPTGGGTIDVTLTGCAIDFGGTVVVSYNGSLGVASVYDSSVLTGSFQFDGLEQGAITLSSQHRVDTGMVVNMVDTSSTWTNLDADALGGGVDTISGVLTVEAYAPSRGQASLVFDAVTLRNVVDGSVCTIDGTIETTSLYP